MRKLRVFVTVSLTTLLSGSLLAATPTKGSIFQTASRASSVPAAHVPQLDGPIITMMTGRSVAAWAYRALSLGRFGFQIDGIQDGPENNDPMGVKGRTVVSDVTQVGPPGGP